VQAAAVAELRAKLGELTADGNGNVAAAAQQLDARLVG
jgi:hypothetical protein